jgi:hypothetical protein
MKEALPGYNLDLHFDELVDYLPTASGGRGWETRELLAVVGEEKG